MKEYVDYDYAKDVLPSLKYQLGVSAAPLVLIISKIDAFSACDNSYLKAAITIAFVILSASVFYLGALMLVAIDFPVSQRALRKEDADTKEHTNGIYKRIRQLDEAIIFYRLAVVAIAYLLVMIVAMMLLWADPCVTPVEATQGTQ